MCRLICTFVVRIWFSHDVAHMFFEHLLCNPSKINERTHEKRVAIHHMGKQWRRGKALPEPSLAAHNVYRTSGSFRKRASSSDYGTYHIGEQRRHRRACASALPRQSLHCSHIWIMEVDEVRTKIRHLAPLDCCACTFEKFVSRGQKVP